MGTEEIFEVIKGKIFPKLIADTKLQIQEAQKTPTRKNSHSKTLHLGISFSNYR